jgi:sensor histidine kinase YesM
VKDANIVPKSLIDIGIKFLGNRLLCHATFWIVVVCTSLTNQAISIIPAQEIKAIACDLFLLISLCYLHIFFTVPQLLYKKKFAWFFSVLLASILMYSYTNFRLYLTIFTQKQLGDVNFTAFISTAVLFGVLCITLKLMRDLALQVYSYGIMQEQHMQQELSFLRNQLSPHFLLNTMNNLYGLAVQQSEQLPSLILRLSDLLRYSIYDGVDNLVPLNEELAYLKDYIELQRIRLNDDIALNVQWPVNIIKAYKISPMILVVFVENAFKHGATSNAGQPKFITLNFTVQNDILCMNLSNSIKQKPEAAPEISVPQNKIKSDGIGLPNTLRRIELIYGKEALPEINTCDNTYNVKLKLKLNND